MKCPSCGHNSRVIESRNTDNGETIRRRRECLHCQRRFTTYERIEQTPLVVIKKNGNKEFFDRRKILNGLNKACEKRNISVEAREAVINDIERTLRNQGKEVTTAQIGETIMAHLLELDQVAYVRFASVYKDFDDIETFVKEIENIRYQVHHHDR